MLRRVKFPTCCINKGVNNGVVTANGSSSPTCEDDSMTLHLGPVEDSTTLLGYAAQDLLVVASHQEDIRVTYWYLLVLSKSCSVVYSNNNQSRS